MVYEPKEEENQCVSACRLIARFLEKVEWLPASPFERLLLGTVARGASTFRTIVDLVESDRTLQAAMLGRPLFEDMVVAHWLVVHEDDPDWLLVRFEDHRDAMRLQEAAVRARGNWLPSKIDVSDLAGRQKYLRDTYGKHAEKDWWGRDREGRHVSMPKLVERLAAEQRFHPRLRGEEPILEQIYEIQHKDATQTLHHTAAGMEMQPGESGALPSLTPPLNGFEILATNYWVFGQLVFVALEYGSEEEAYRDFEELFLLGLEAFGNEAGVELSVVET
jgi:uncharacterized protein DUF5677